jgi:hypothetical protein
MRGIWCTRVSFEKVTFAAFIIGGGCILCLCVSVPVSGSSSFYAFSYSYNTKKNRCGFRRGSPAAIPKNATHTSLP